MRSRLRNGLKWVNTTLKLVVTILVIAEGSNEQCQAKLADHHQETGFTCTGPRDISEYEQQVIRHPSYRKVLTPNQACGNTEPIKVEASFYLVYVDAINQMLGQVTLGGYFRQYWKDPRLAYNTTEQGGCFNSIAMPSEFNPSTSIWTPNLYMDNGVVWKKDGARATHIHPDGSVFQSDESQITVKVDMRFDAMPFDEHVIKLVVGSYSMDTRVLRLVARGGAVGESSGGVGMLSTQLGNPMWDIEDGASKEEGGFKTVGLVEVKVFDGIGWDYVSMTMRIRRNPFFLVQQVLVQDFFFLGVSYAGFWVNPAVAPARAAMAVIPVLIMRTLANAVFQGLPQLSYNVWLADYLLGSMCLCVLCVFQFAVTQYCLLQEGAGTKRFEKLQATDVDMRMIINEARQKGMGTLEYVESLTLTELAEDRLASWNYSEAQSPRVTKPANLALANRTAKASFEEGTGQPALSSGGRTKVTEARLGVLEHATKMFKKFDKDGSGALAPSEIRKMLTTYNVWMTTEDVGVAMCKFQRDKGLTSPKNVRKAEMKLGQFIEFLHDIDDYLIAVPAHFRHPFSPAIAPSRRWDIAAQWFFIPVVLLKMIIWYAIIGVYLNNAKRL